MTTKTSTDIWSIDATGCLADEGSAAVFVLVDHCTDDCLGLRAAGRGTRFEAIDYLREAIHFTKGRYEDNIAQGTKLRHDQAASSSRTPSRTSSTPSVSSARPSSSSPKATDALDGSSEP